MKTFVILASDECSIRMTYVKSYSTLRRATCDKSFNCYAPNKLNRRIASEWSLISRLSALGFSRFDWIP